MVTVTAITVPIVPVPELSPHVATALFVAIWVLRRAIFCRAGLHPWLAYDLRGTSAAKTVRFALQGKLCAVCTGLQA